MLVACLCNQPGRLPEALARVPLTAPAPVGPWGMAWARGGEVLLSRTPRGGDGPLDLGAALAEPRSDCAMAALAAGDVADPDDLPPFRFRRLMLVEWPAQVLGPDDGAALAVAVPDFLRRNLRGRASGELLLLTVAALLHQRGRGDELELRVEVLAEVARAADAVLAEARARRGLPPATGAFALSNTRSLVAVGRDRPLAIDALRVDTDRGAPDPSFRGVAISTAVTRDRDQAVPELAPPGVVVAVSRDLAVTLG